MALTTPLLLKIFLGLVCLDGLVELATAVSCIGWVNSGAAGPYTLNDPSGHGTFTIPSRPQHLLTSMASLPSAAGALAAVVAVGGFLALRLRRSSKNRLASLWVAAWPYACVAMALFTLAATIALNVEIDKRDGQRVDPVLAEALGDGTKYPVDSWTFLNWFSAVRGLVAVKGTEHTVQAHVNTMKTWRWNLVPLVIFQAVLSVLAWVESRQWSMRARTETGVGKMGDLEASASAEKGTAH